MDERRRLMMAGGLSVNPILELNEWQIISAISRAGKAQYYWNIGDTKSIDIGGKSYTVRIIGFDHDTVTDSATYGRSKAGITFELAEIYDLRTHTSDTVSEWESNFMRGLMSSYYEPKLVNNKSLLDVIVAVNKPYMVGSSTVAYTSDRLFLLSSREVSTHSTTFSKEGPQYAFYSAGNSRFKQYNGSNTGWWTRSRPNGTSFSSSISYVTNKVSSSPVANASVSGSGSSKGVSFAFCV